MASKKELQANNETTRERLRELCAAYLASDQWGRDHIMKTALRQQAKGDKKLSGKLRLVSSASLNQEAHFLNDIINRLPLTIIR
jgi:hypothetical protein